MGPSAWARVPCAIPGERALARPSSPPAFGTRGWSVHRVDFGCPARDSPAHTRARVVADQGRRDVADRAAERRADALSRWLVHGRERRRHVRARSGGRIALDRGTPLVHVLLDGGGQRVSAGIRNTPSVAGGGRRELAQRPLP